MVGLPPSNSAALCAHAVCAAPPRAPPGRSALYRLYCPYRRALRRYNKEALRLRIFYLLNQPPGAESHTILCQDVPGVAWGTIPNRADGTLLKIIPKSECACGGVGWGRRAGAAACMHCVRAGRGEGGGGGQARMPRRLDVVCVCAQAS